MTAGAPADADADDAETVVNARADKVAVAAVVQAVRVHLHRVACGEWSRWGCIAGDVVVEVPFSSPRHDAIEVAGCRHHSLSIHPSINPFVLSFVRLSASYSYSLKRTDGPMNEQMDL